MNDARKDYENDITVGELIQSLSNFDNELKVLIYPKYSSHEVDGYKKHNFKKQNVGLRQDNKKTDYITITF